MTMKYASVVPKEIVSHYGSDFRSHPIGSFPIEIMGRKCKLVLRKTLYFMKREKGNALPYLEAVAITFYRISKVVFAIYTRKIRFHFRPRSFL
jgi:peptide/nickel transport system substrate-binding protein